MNRRAFVTGLGAVLAAPRVALAQWARQPRVGILVSGSRQQTEHFVSAFEDGMRSFGYIEGRTVAFERRFANGKTELLPDLAAEMVRLKLDVIVTGSNQQTVVLKRATTTIPIVAMFLSDPIMNGL